MTDPVLPALRAATGKAHQAFEDAVAIDRCLADPARYRQILEIFLGFYRPLERRLIVPAGSDSDERRKTPWLEADLGAIGLTAAQIAGLPDCSDLPRVDTPARSFGCLYVLEGATLGGRHISAMMAQSTVPPGARQFFGGYGEHTGERWREFIGALERHAAGAGDADREETIQGAEETFACLHRWYVRQSPANDLPG